VRPVPDATIPAATHRPRTERDYEADVRTL
jgi:hypothetical protein